MSEIQLTTLIFIASGALSFLSAPLFSIFLIPIAHRIGAIDVPRDKRRMHTKPIARIGGVAIYLSFLIGGALFSPLCRPLFSYSTATLLRAIAIGGGVIVIGGLADDIFSLSPWQKIIYQLLAASAAAACGIRLFDGALGVLGSILLSVLLSNAFNLIDGLDGLCGGISVSALIALTAILSGEGASLLLLSAALGFLPLNLRPARLFLGDSGSMLLGFSISVIASRLFFLSPTSVTATSLALILVLPLSDTALAVVRRVGKGKSPFSPDREHLHHRLVDRGLPHGRASLFLVLLAAGFSALGATIFITGFSFPSLILSILLIFPTASAIMMGKNAKVKF